ncbi:histidine kinase [Micromonospora sp. NPDC000207]|uniref:sensor histidine kinase n=1 Tax=Micromonospora sp. NPDC000207 TaxID=3154246 RepID=UPI0033324816
MTETIQRWLGRAGTVFALTGMGVLWLFETTFGNPGAGPYTALVMVARGFLTVAAAGVWLAAHRLGPTRSAVAATLVALGSAGLSIGPVVLLGLGAGDYRDIRYVGLAPTFWGLPESLALLGVVFALARIARPVPAMVALGCTGFALAVMPLRSGTEFVYLFFGMVYALVAAGVAAGGMYLRLTAAVRDRQLAAVRAEQRAEFARDLHDFIAHHVTGIVVQAQGARYVAARDPGRAVEALERIEHAGAETMTAMRRMVGVLRDDAAPDAPLAPLVDVADLPDLVGRFSAADGVPAHLHTEGTLDDLPVEVTSSAYRVVMEALTNVRRHARGARRVDVWVSRTPDRLLVRVSDDAPTTRAATRRGSRQGFGLVGLTERVAATGGRLRFGPGVDGGWTVDAELPLTRGTVPR